MKSLPDFFTKLKAALAIETPTTNVLYGAEATSRRDGQGTPSTNRVVVIPHKPDGTRGQFLVVRHAHRVPADIGVHRRWVTIECWAFDLANPVDRAKQDDAAEILVQAVWRNTQAIVRAEYHSGIPGEVPGFYQVEETTPVAPTERVAGVKVVMVFWIDFAVRELEPTTLDEPGLVVTAELEQP
jgi:hypothetical protein